MDLILFSEGFVLHVLPINVYIIYIYIFTAG